jgi:signal transduction histidine kinase
MDKIRGCAFICDERGVIQKVLRDDFGFTQPEKCKGKLFSSLFIEQSYTKAMNMIMEAKTRRIAFDYRLDAYHKKQFKSLYFMSVHLSDKLLVIGADNHKEAIEFTNRLQQINNEQANQIRELVKNQSKILSENYKESEDLFSELSRLNNELINLQRQMNKKNAELARLNELKNNFLGMAAHDLRNPLSNVYALADLIQKKDENLDEQQKRFIQHIKTLGKSMLDLVSELLDVSVIESGEVDIKRIPDNIVSLIETSIILNKDLARKKEIEIQFKTNTDTIILDIDRVKIDQVITNLLTNAIKFSNRNTQINITLEKKESELLIEVKDKGQGIQKDEISNLFKPFKRTSTISTDGEKSTGLGLFIVKRIIDAHNGNIKVESEIEKGTVFTITLPLKATES